MEIVTVTHQGAPLVNADNVTEKVCGDIALLTIDMRSKYCEIMAQSSYSVIICANKYSLHLKDDIDRSEPTDLELTKYKGWNIFVSEISRYTLRVCLVKEQAEKNQMTYGCPKCSWSISFDKLRKMVLSRKDDSKLSDIFKCPECGYTIPFDILG